MLPNPAPHYHPRHDIMPGDTYLVADYVAMVKARHKLTRQVQRVKGAPIGVHRADRSRDDARP